MRFRMLLNARENGRLKTVTVFPPAVSAIGLVRLVIIWFIFGRKTPKQDLEVP